MADNERYVMIVLKELNEIQIVDTEEDNVLILNCEYRDEDDLFFAKQELDTVLRLLNFQNEYINELIEKKLKLEGTIKEVVGEYYELFG